MALRFPWRAENWGGTAIATGSWGRSWRKMVELTGENGDLMGYSGERPWGKLPCGGPMVSMKPAVFVTWLYSINVHQWGYPNSWMVYHGKNLRKKWISGCPYGYGNLHIYERWMILAIRKICRGSSQCLNISRKIPGWSSWWSSTPVSTGSSHCSYHWVVTIRFFIIHPVKSLVG